jgi:periplasmic protein TonB
MGVTLISTGARSGRSKRGLAFSIALHSAIIVAAAAGTTYAKAELEKPVEEKLTFISPANEPPPKKVFVAPKEPPPQAPKPKQPQAAPRVQMQAPPPVAKAAAPAPRPAAQPVAANVPVMPVAPVDIPSGLPKIDLDATAMLGDVVRRAGDEIAKAGTGSGIGTRSTSSEGSGTGTRAVAESFGNTAFDDSQVDQVVVPIVNANPEYPSRLRNAGVTGTVQVRFIVGANGRVETSSIKIVSTPHPDFVEGVRRALQNARFKAAEKGGTKVRQLVEQSFVFQLDR